MTSVFVVFALGPLWTGWFPSNTILKRGCILNFGTPPSVSKLSICAILSLGRGFKSQFRVGMDEARMYKPPTSASQGDWWQVQRCSIVDARKL